MTTPDDKTLIEQLKALHALVESDTVRHWVGTAIMRLQELTHGDVVVVPREATDYMIIAGIDAARVDNESIEQIYTAMINAAQKERG